MTGQTIACASPFEVMQAAELRINGEEASLGAVWVHLKAPPASALPLSLLIRGEFVFEVLGGGRGKPKEMSWEEFIQNQLQVFGNLAVSCYVQVLQKIDQVEGQRKLWVITNVQSVRAVVSSKDWSKGSGRLKYPH